MDSELVNEVSEVSDLAKVKAMEEANWKPAAQYWREQSESKQARIEKLERELELYKESAQHNLVSEENLRDKLAAEKELADRLAGDVAWLLSESETNRGSEPMPNHRGESWDEINHYWIFNEDMADADLEAYRKARGL